LRGCALRWWKNYKFKRRRKGIEKLRTWKKLRGKLMVSFCPQTYILKQVPPLSKKNGPKSSCVDVHLKKGSPKSSCVFIAFFFLDHVFKDLVSSFERDQYFVSKLVSF